MAKPEIVSIADLDLAAQWLDYYEDQEAENNEAEACKRVAAWIRAEIDKREAKSAQEAAIRGVAREKGVSVEEVRKAIREHRAKHRQA